ncbi:MAG: MFS transporter [Nitrospirae bacterium]|nr:MFS transporter [Nitrospirota bacterium]
MNERRQVMSHPEERRFNLRALLILSLGHLCTDVQQGALPAILPFLKERLALSYSLAGTIIFASNFASSVIQPLFGYLTDRKEKPLLLPAGCLLAGAGFALLTLPVHYALLLVFVITGGLGVAAYHPEGFKTAHYFTGARAATGMAVFSVGGNLGFALGPIAALSIVTHFGFSYLPLMFTFSLLFLSVAAVFRNTLSIPGRTRATGAPATEESGKGAFFPLILLIGTVVMRSWAHAGLMTYIPFYYIDYLKGDPVYAGKLVSFFLLGGVLGTMAGSPLADRWGHKRYLVLSMLAASLLFPLILILKGGALLVVLAVFGMVLISTFTVTIVMAQKLLPKNLGVASGLMVGFAIGTGGIGVTILGVLADGFGVPFALKSIIVLPVTGFLLSLFVKYR